jgi:beta-glucosidase
MNRGERRPRQRIRGVAKVRLESGEMKPAKASLDICALAFLDVARKAWLAEPGACALLAGFSSAEIVVSARFTLSKNLD